MHRLIHRVTHTSSTRAGTSISGPTTMASACPLPDPAIIVVASRLEARTTFTWRRVGVE